MTDTSKIHVINHPLLQHKLTFLRSKETSTRDFRTLLREVSMLLAYEITKRFPTEMIDIETPLAKMESPVIAGKKPCVISILRAGNGLLDGVLDVMPPARVGFIGLYRDPKTLQPVEYYYKVPNKMNERQVIVVDPMLATGNSAIASIERIKEDNPKSISFMCLLASQYGIDKLHEAHPDVDIYTPLIDPDLNEKGYILPGLGDAGDRIFGTL